MPVKTRFRIVIGPVLVVCWLLAGPAWAGWTRQVVDTGGWDLLWNSLAVDDYGNVHLSYYDRALGALKYATNASGAWETQTLLSGGAHDSDSTSLAVDDQGAVHIVVTGINDLQLKYLTNAGGAWTIQNIDRLATLAKVAVDGNGKVHIVYAGVDNHFCIRHASNETGLWNFSEVLAMQGATGLSLAVDGEGRVHAAYIRLISASEAGGAHSAIGYAVRNGSVWENTVIEDSSNLISVGIGLAADAQGRAHIVYHNTMDGSLGYANNTPRERLAEILPGRTGPARLCLSRRGRGPRQPGPRLLRRGRVRGQWGRARPAKGLLLGPGRGGRQHGGKSPPPPWRWARTTRSMWATGMTWRMP